MAAIPSGRSRLAAFFSAAVVASLAALSFGMSPLVALSVEVDVAAFSQRAEAWRQANIVHLQQALVHAEQLGTRVQEKEAAREQKEAERVRAAQAVTVTSTTVPPVTVTSTTVPAVTDPPSGGPTAEQWAALRHCESSGRYDALNPSHRYRGAYQFSQQTWDWVAGWANPSLIGTDPAAASPADQDAQALALYEVRGASPWPKCGVYLS